MVSIARWPLPGIRIESEMEASKMEKRDKTFFKIDQCHIRELHDGTISTCVSESICVNENNPTSRNVSNGGTCLATERRLWEINFPRCDDDDEVMRLD